VLEAVGTDHASLAKQACSEQFDVRPASVEPLALAVKAGHVDTVRAILSRVDALKRFDVDMDCAAALADPSMLTLLLEGRLLRPLAADSAARIAGRLGHVGHLDLLLARHLSPDNVREKCVSDGGQGG
jgi:hypothetical protein